METKLHPSIIIENILSRFAIIIVIGYSFVMQMTPEKLKELSTHLNIAPNIILLSLLAILLVTIAFAILYFIKWKNMNVTISKENLDVDMGKLFHKHITLKINDIASINLKQNIIEKIFGTANIIIELNTNDTTGLPRLVFSKEKAIQIKNYIIGEKVSEEFDSLIDFNKKDILRHMLLSINPVSLVLIIIIYGAVIINTITSTKNLTFMIISTLIIIVPYIFGILKNYFSYYNFKLNIIKDKIKIAHGFFTTFQFNVPVKKINAIIVFQTLQAHLMNYSIIKYVSAGEDDNKEEKKLLCPYYKNIDYIIKSILPKYSKNVELNRGNKKSFYNYFLNILIIVIISILLVKVTNFVSLIFILLIPYMYLKYKNEYIGFDKENLVIKKGVINKSTIILKLEDIEHIFIKSNFYGNFLNTGTLTIRVVGNGVQNTFKTGIFDLKQLDSIVSNYMEISYD